MQSPFPPPPHHLYEKARASMLASGDCGLAALQLDLRVSYARAKLLRDAMRGDLLDYNPQDGWHFIIPATADAVTQAQREYMHWKSKTLQRLLQASVVASSNWQQDASTAVDRFDPKLQLVLGLQQQMVRLVEHNPQWIPLGQQVCQDIARSCGHLISDVQHIGSTSVPSLPAMPILDLAIALPDWANLPDLALQLHQMGYLYRADFAGKHMFVIAPTPNTRSAHVHVLHDSQPQWQQHLQFRDQLQSCAQIRDDYASLKRQLAREYPQNRTAYLQGKQHFVEAQLQADLTSASA